MSCVCQRPSIAVIRNPIRTFSRGEFERTGDFGRGTFERTDNFGGVWGSIGGAFSWVGKNVLVPLLPAGLQIGAGLATQAIMGRSGAAQPAPAQQQSPLTTATSQLEAEAAAKAAEEKTKQTYIIVGAAAALALFLIYKSRRKR